MPGQFRSALLRAWARGPGQRGSGQRGSGTVLVAAVVLVLLAVTGAALVVAAYLAAADRARGAADLVAVSAAAERSRGGDACAAAARIARLNGVGLAGCAIRGDSLDFVVTITVRQPIAVNLPLLPTAVPATSNAGRLGIAVG